MRPDKLIRSNRKTIALQIDENARLIVRAPYLVSASRINKFIEEKSDWILKKRAQITKRNNETEQNREFRDGKKVLFLGRKYEISLNGKIDSIITQEDYLEFPFKHIDDAEEYLIKWYKKKAREIIIPHVAQHAKALGLKYNKISITSAQKRWGSCNSNGNINFTYRLVMAPPGIIDYVIVHELMHLKELNHSEKFWENVASVIPDYKKHRKWLRDNQYRFII